MLEVSNSIKVSLSEIELTAICAQGAGGQNVNKVSSAIHLRFDIKASSLPDFYKGRLLSFKDKRITKNGILIIKAQQFRTQEKNREDALNRLKELIQKAIFIPETRRATKPSRSSQRKRLDQKSKRSETKARRVKVDY